MEKRVLFLKIAAKSVLVGLCVIGLVRLFLGSFENSVIS